MFVETWWEIQQDLDSFLLFSSCWDLRTKSSAVLTCNSWSLNPWWWTSLYSEKWPFEVADHYGTTRFLFAKDLNGPKTPKFLHEPELTTFFSRDTVGLNPWVVMIFHYIYIHLQYICNSLREGDLSLTCFNHLMMNISYEVFCEQRRFEIGPNECFSLWSSTHGKNYQLPKLAKVIFGDQNFTGPEPSKSMKSKWLWFQGDFCQLIDPLTYENEMLEIWSYTVSMNTVFFQKGHIFCMIVNVIYVWYYLFMYDITYCIHDIFGGFGGLALSRLARCHLQRSMYLR